MKHARHSHHRGAMGISLMFFAAAAILVKYIWGLVEVSASSSAAMSWGLASLIGLIVAVAVYFVSHPRRHRAQRHAKDAEHA